MKKVRFDENSSSRMESTEKQTEQTANNFLVQGPNQPKPPIMEAGNGYGGAPTQTVIDLLNHLIRIQNQQYQMLQAAQILKTPQPDQIPQMPQMIHPIGIGQIHQSGMGQRNLFM